MGDARSTSSPLAGGSNHHCSGGSLVRWAARLNPIQKIRPFTGKAAEGVGLAGAAPFQPLYIIKRFPRLCPEIRPSPLRNGLRLLPSDAAESVGLGVSMRFNVKATDIVRGFIPSSPFRSSIRMSRLGVFPCRFDSLRIYLAHLSVDALRGGGGCRTGRCPDSNSLYYYEFHHPSADRASPSPPAPERGRRAPKYPQLPSAEISRGTTCNSGIARYLR